MSAERKLLAVLVLISAVATSLVVAVVAWRGIYISPDSAKYLFAATALSGGEGYLDTDGGHLVDFPPLYPALIAAIMFIAPVGAESAATVVAAVATFTAVLAFATALRKLLPTNVHTAWLIAGTIVFAFSSSFLTIQTSAWSEVPFYALILWAGATQAGDGPGRSRRAWVVALLLAMASLGRTAGLFVIAAAVFVELLRRRPGRAAIVASAAVAPAAWAFINTQLAQAPTVERGASDMGPLRVVAGGARWMLQWFSPALGPLAAQLVAGIVVAGLITVALVTGFRQWQLVVVPAIYFAALLVGTFGTRIVVALDGLGLKLLAPLAPFLLLCIVVGLAMNRRPKLAVVAMVALLVSTVSASAVHLLQPRPSQVQLSAEAACPILPAGSIMSNEPAQLAYACGREIEESPRHRLYGSSTTVNEIPQFAASARKECVSVVWFPDDATRIHVTPEEMRSAVPLRRVGAGGEPVEIYSTC